MDIFITGGTEGGLTSRADVGEEAATIEGRLDGVGRKKRIRLLFLWVVVGGVVGSVWWNEGVKAAEAGGPTIAFILFVVLGQEVNFMEAGDGEEVVIGCREVGCLDEGEVADGAVTWKSGDAGGAARTGESFNVPFELERRLGSVGFAGVGRDGADFRARGVDS